MARVGGRTWGARTLRDYDPMAEMAGRVGRAVPYARDIMEGIQGPGPQWGDVKAPAVAGMQRLLAPKVSPQARAKAVGGITRTFGTQTGRLAGAGAGRGYFSREGVATGAAGAPSAALGRSLSDYYVGEQKEKARQTEAGLSAVSGMQGPVTAAERGRGAWTGLLAKQKGIQHLGPSWRRYTGSSPVRGPQSGNLWAR